MVCKSALKISGTMFYYRSLNGPYTIFNIANFTEKNYVFSPLFLIIKPNEIETLIKLIKYDYKVILSNSNVARINFYKNYRYTDLQPFLRNI